MQFIVAILISIAATSLMTLSGFLLSDFTRVRFSEPIALGQVISRNSNPVNRNKYLGWILHYLFGVVIVLIYHYVFLSIVAPSWVIAMLLGTSGSILSVCCWKFIENKSYNFRFQVSDLYGQLFISHLIFAFSVIGIYQLGYYLFNIY